MASRRMNADATPVDGGAALRACLKTHYRTGRDVLADDFFAPCMLAARRYRRSVGYFSTSALLSWTAALPSVAAEGGLTIRLIASPEVSASDHDTLRELGTPEGRAGFRQVIVDKVLDDIAKLIETPGDVALRAGVFAWLVANERIELKFAFADHLEDPGIFHEKIGVFDLADGGRVAFTGSANETFGGHRRNYESIDVYRDWIAGEEERVCVKAEQFDETWDDSAIGLKVFAPSPEVMLRVKAAAPAHLPRTPPTRRGGGIQASPTEPEPADFDLRWRHQDEAVEAFLPARVGVLEMATGTGKTRTALKLLDRLIRAGEIDSAIVAMDGTDLLDQWAAELDAWSLASAAGWIVYRHFERHHELGEYALDPKGSVIVVSRGQLRKLLERMPPRTASRCLIVHDEVHGLGTPSLVASLTGRHAVFGWRLGLSATPDRAYDAAGNAFIASELGPTLYRFPLEAAIERGVLSEFDYLPLPYELTDGDRDRIQQVYAKKARRAREGNPMSSEEVWTELSKVYKTAEMKPEVFAGHLQSDPGAIRRSIVFVETKEYGERIIAILDRHTHSYRTYYAEDDRDHLVAFARGEIECLVTCHRVSQGIDIRSLGTVILFSSARAKLETIQRIGRCLRSDPADPGKRARVIDFVRPAGAGDTEPNADQERCAWLQALSMTRRKGAGIGDR